MKHRYTIPGCILLATLLGGCFNGGGGGGGSASANTLQTLANASPNDEPGVILSPAQLKNDIRNLFGEANGKPVAVNRGDSLQTVLNRAGGN